MIKICNYVPTESPQWMPFCGPGLLLAAVLFLMHAVADAAPPTAPSALEGTFLSPPLPVTAGMPKAGEGYFSPAARQICYQAVPDGFPFYQIFVQDFDAAAIKPAPPRRVSPGRGRTTCSWFSPDGTRLLFASSHLDPNIDATETQAREQAEEDRRTGRRRRSLRKARLGTGREGVEGDFLQDRHLFVRDPLHRVRLRALATATVADPGEIGLQAER